MRVTTTAKQNPVVISALLIAALLIAMGATANAQLLHRYNFEVDASDSVGSADGAIYGSASITGGGVYSGGSGILGQLSGGLPQNGAGLPASAVSGITGAFTIECWLQTPFGGGYTTAFSFSDGTTSQYVLGTPARGNAPYASSIASIGGGGNTFEQQAAGRYFDTDELLQMLVTYDGTTLTYYQNSQTDFGGFNSGNGLSASIVNPGLNLSTLTQIGVNGGAPWPDNSMAGTVFDFRIYSQALTRIRWQASIALEQTPAMVTSLQQSSRNLSTLALAGLGMLGILMARRRS